MRQVSLSTRPRFGDDWAERGRVRVACSMEVEEGRRESGAERLWVLQASAVGRT
jgi:hypothetical protein